MEQEKFMYPMQEEQLFFSDNVITLQPEEKAVLQELLAHDCDGDGSYIRIDKAFNKQLLAVARRLLEQG